jgi:hypothetical protein
MTKLASSSVAASRELLGHILEHLNLKKETACLRVTKAFWYEASAHLYRDLMEGEVHQLLNQPDNVRPHSN